MRKPTCKIRGAKNKREGYPCSKWTGKHGVALLQDRSYEEQVETNDNRKEDRRRLPRACVCKFAEVQPRYSDEANWGSDGMDNERFRHRKKLSRDANEQTAVSPPRHCVREDHRCPEKSPRIRHGDVVVPS